MTNGTAVLLAALLALPACDEVKRARREEAARLTGGNPAQGRAAISRLGCASCHTIPGIPGADANVGPSLDRIGSRGYIAGVLLNISDNLARWLKNPPAVDPRGHARRRRVRGRGPRHLRLPLHTPFSPLLGGRE